MSMTKKQALSEASEQVSGPFNAGFRGYGYKVYSEHRDAWWIHDTGGTYQQVQKKVSDAKAAKAAGKWLSANTDTPNKDIPYGHSTLKSLNRRGVSLSNASSTRDKMNDAIDYVADELNLDI